MSEQQSSSSDKLLYAVESGSVERVRRVLGSIAAEGIQSWVILQPSHDTKHGLKTPLMAAAATGDVEVFATVVHAFERVFGQKAALREKQMRLQLLLQDKCGLTLAMHASRGGSAVVLASVMAEVRGVKAYEVLSAKDHRQRTLLIHAAAAGKAPLFREVFHAMEMALTDEQLEESVVMRSGEDRTLLMISAASGDKMAFKTCVESLRMVLNPHEFRALMKARDADGMTFMMHAANPSNRCMNRQLRTVPSTNTSRPRYGSATQSGKMTVPISSSSMHKGTISSSEEELSQVPRLLGARGSGVLRRRSSKQLDAVEESDVQEGVRDVNNDSKEESKHDGSLFPQRVRTGSSRERVDSATTPSVPYQHVPDDHVGKDAEMAEVGGRDGQGIIAAEQQHLVLAGCTLDPRVPVLKAAISLNKEYLWKEQVRDMLTAQDSWGRTLITHGILSGSPQVFEVAFVAVRNDVLDEEVEALLECGGQYDNTNPLLMAKNTGNEEMESIVSRRIAHLKRDVELQAKASTLEAKIQSFIPGKLIVYQRAVSKSNPLLPPAEGAAPDALPTGAGEGLAQNAVKRGALIFQLLLPEVPSTQGTFERLALLLAMSLLAPILAWVSSLRLANRERSSNDPDTVVPRRSFYSFALSAPAMFVWGVGTSTIFEDGWGWPESRAAAVLAVGTIVIPAVDGFMNSQRVEQWNDKFSLSKWRFSRQAAMAWQKARAQKAKRITYDKTMLQQRDLQNMDKAAGAPKPDFGAAWGHYHPFQETVTEAVPSTLTTPSRALDEVEQKSSEEV